MPPLTTSRPLRDTTVTFILPPAGSRGRAGRGERERRLGLLLPAGVAVETWREVETERRGSGRAEVAYLIPAAGRWARVQVGGVGPTGVMWLAQHLDVDRVHGVPAAAELGVRDLGLGVGSDTGGIPAQSL